MCLCKVRSKFLLIHFVLFLPPFQHWTYIYWSELAQSCPTLCDPMDSSQPSSSAHGIFQARILEWVVISFSRGSSWPRDRTQVSHIVGRSFTVWATREAHSWTTVRGSNCPRPQTNVLPLFQSNPQQDESSNFIGIPGAPCENQSTLLITTFWYWILACVWFV